jgi:hypothetical protein
MQSAPVHGSIDQQTQYTYMRLQHDHAPALAKHPMEFLQSFAGVLQVMKNICQDQVGTVSSANDNL